MAEYVTLVTRGGTPVRLANAFGVPYPTSGSGSLVFSDSATFTNPVFVNPTYTGNYTFAGNLSIGGNATVAGTSSVAGAQTVGGALTVTGAISTATNAIIGGYITVAGNATVTGSASVGTSLTVGTTLAVTGATTLAAATATSLNRVIVTAPATGATLTLANNSTLQTVGAYATAFTFSGATNVTFPTTGTLATLAGAESLTNKTYNGHTWTAGSGTLTMGGNLVTSGAYNLTATLTANTAVTFPTSGTLAVVGGPETEPFTTKTANYTVTTSDGIVLCTTNAFTITLPTAVGLTGRKFTIKNGNTAASGNVITMATTSAQTIDGLAPSTLAPLVSLTFVSNNVNWWIV